MEMGGSGRASPPQRAKALVGDPGSHDAHLNDDKTVVKMGHPVLWWGGH